MYFQIVRGVHFIHSRGVLHLDLKPFNIMFANPQDDYNLRIIDFGLAEQLDDNSEHCIMKMCGTLEYMSPEVMDCKHASRASGKAKLFNTQKKSILLSTLFCFLQNYQEMLTC